MGAVVIRHAADIECEILPVISPFVFASIISVGIGSLTSRVSSTVQELVCWGDSSSVSEVVDRVALRCGGQRFSAPQRVQLGHEKIFVAVERPCRAVSDHHAVATPFGSVRDPMAAPGKLCEMVPMWEWTLRGRPRLFNAGSRQ